MRTKLTFLPHLKLPSETFQMLKKKKMMPLTHFLFAFKSCSKHVFSNGKGKNGGNSKSQGTNFVWKENTAVESLGYDYIKRKKIGKNTLNLVNALV